MAETRKTFDTKKTFYFDEEVLNEFLNIAHWGYANSAAPMNEALKDFTAKWKTDKANKMFVTGGKVKQRPTKD